MTMMRETLLTGAIAGLAVVAIALGLTLTGGLTRGKAEQRDKTRITALKEARDLVKCLANQNDWSLPETLEANEACASLDSLHDPISGTAVRYERLNSKEYHLCPDLELPEDFRDGRWPYAGEYHAETDCVRYRYRP